MNIEITDHPAAARFEIRVDGVLGGIAEYQRSEAEIAFTHTETAPEFAGQGLARQLVETALTAAGDEGLAVLPYCPYVRKVIADAPQRWLDLVPAARRAEFDLPA